MQHPIRGLIVAATVVALSACGATRSERKTEVVEAHSVIYKPAAAEDRELAFEEVRRTPTHRTLRLFRKNRSLGYVRDREVDYERYITKANVPMAAFMGVIGIPSFIVIDAMSMFMMCLRDQCLTATAFEMMGDHLGRVGEWEERSSRFVNERHNGEFKVKKQLLASTRVLTVSGGAKTWRGTDKSGQLTVPLSRPGAEHTVFENYQGVVVMEQ